MKRLFNYIASTFLALTLLMTPNAHATSVVSFENNADRFVFYNASDSDLFSDFHALMPGDTLSADIAVKNTAAEYDFVKIYLRAEPDPSSSTFLEKLNLNLYQDGTLLSSAPASDPAVLTENFELGTFNPGAETLLTVELSAPLTLENDFQFAGGGINWIFTAEAYKDGKIIAPDTGAAPTIGITLALPGILFAALLTTTLVLLINKRKMRK
ncbi:hypothetical protein IKE71_01110 [Candidatus Saccharibacteria bacterium]|nr:hypothetical protein [Candidatus Saccharibacteria bacterium]